MIASRLSLRRGARAGAAGQAARAAPADAVPGAEDRVAVITDSTASLSGESIDELSIGVVPLRVRLGEREVIDGAVSAEEVLAALRARVAVSTSRPAPAQFAAAYRARLDAGARHVVSVHLSATLSGTWESAVLAAQEFGYGTVRVVDSRSAAMGVGFAVAAAARAARDGAPVGTVQDAAVEVIDHTRVLFYVDTLEYLRRGGRVGAAAALLATSLSVKPLLQMIDGQITPLEKVRTTSKAIARLIALAIEASGTGAVNLAVHHLAAAERAEQVAAALRAQVPGARQIVVGELGPVLGVHLGPGAIGVVVAPAVPRLG